MRKVKMMKAEMPCVGINGEFSGASLILNPKKAADELMFLRRSDNNCGVKEVKWKNFTYFYTENGYGDWGAAFCIPNYIRETMEVYLNK